MRGVSLRAFRPADFEAIYRFACDPESGWSWRYRGLTPSPEVFSRQLWEGVFCQYVVAESDRHPPAGLVSLYNVNQSSGCGYFQALSSASPSDSLRTIAGPGLLLDRAFELWQFRKVYFEVPGYNVERLLSLIGKYTIEEGRLQAHEFLWGQYWDQRILALYRDTWLENSFRILGWRNKPASMSAFDPEGQADGVVNARVR